MMKLRRFSVLFGTIMIASGYVACGNTASSDDDLGGAPGSGGIASGGKASGGLGGDVIINIGTGGATGGASSGGSGGTASGGAIQEGSLAVCQVGSGPSVGDPSGSLIIDTFDDGQVGFSGNGLSGGFYGFTDGTGIQEPTGDYLDNAVESGGVTESGFALHVRGSGQTDWGSGFGAIFSVNESGECVFDASNYTGVTFWAKGSIVPEQAGGARPGLLRFKIQEKDILPQSRGGNCPDEASCYDSRGANFSIDECWTQYSFAFSELLPEGWGYPGGALDLNELHTLEFGIGQYSDYDIWVDDLRFFVGEKPTAEPVCDDGMGGMGGMGE